jgi:hypothetical protein
MKIRFKKELQKLGKKFMQYLEDCCYNSFVIKYDRWQDGGFVGTIQEIAKDYHKDYKNEVIISTDTEGAKKIVKDFISYIVNAESWEKEDKFGYFVYDNIFELWLYSPYFGGEHIIIKNV